jgi:hypothetical protein
MKGFSNRWHEWIQTFVTIGCVAIKVNDVIDHYLQKKKSLCHGDALSPTLVERAKQDDQIVVVVPHMVDGDLSIL